MVQQSSNLAVWAGGSEAGSGGVCFPQSIMMALRWKDRELDGNGLSRHALTACIRRKGQHMSAWTAMLVGARLPSWCRHARRMSPVTSVTARLCSAPPLWGDVHSWRQANLKFRMSVACEKLHALLAPSCGTRVQIQRYKLCCGMSRPQARRQSNAPLGPFAVPPRFGQGQTEAQMWF